MDKEVCLYLAPLFAFNPASFEPPILGMGSEVKVESADIHEQYSSCLLWLKFDQSLEMWSSLNSICIKRFRNGSFTSHSSPRLLSILKKLDTSLSYILYYLYCECFTKKYILKIKIYLKIEI